MPGCQGRKLIGTKCQKQTSGTDMSAAIAALQATREAQDHRYFGQRPVDPNPPVPLRVAGPGNSSTTMTSNQGTKSPATSWQ